ncbi:hypothetical protein HNP67_001066 [Borreliella californiensis]|uniref:Tyr recombinase domain-containing protein n=1 Tax=Borreliella californiensis TaxID=373543 RepID=A0A7W9ZNH9_9SPIR|nr:hypothetical protein [Borreliella californiensis]MBB6213571.1 hypothetical protein [Borreliella californiensis]
MIQDALIFLKNPNISLKIIKLALYIFLSNKFKNLLKESGFRANKSLHLCRNLFISNLKSNGYNSFQIKELMKYSSTSEIDNIYGLSAANKIQAYESIKNTLKL